MRTPRSFRALDSILDSDAGEYVAAQCVVNTSGHIAVHEQRIGGKSNDRRLLIGQIVDAQPDIHMLPDIDRIIEWDAAGKAERQVAGFRRQRFEFPYVATLEVDAAVAVGTRIEARADDAAGGRAVAGGQRAAGVAMNQSAVERVAGVQA